MYCKEFNHGCFLQKKSNIENLLKRSYLVMIPFSFNKSIVIFHIIRFTQFRICMDSLTCIREITITILLQRLNQIWLKGRRNRFFTVNVISWYQNKYNETLYLINQTSNASMKVTITTQNATNTRNYIIQSVSTHRYMTQSQPFPYSRYHTSVWVSFPNEASISPQEATASFSLHQFVCMQLLMN